MLVFLFGVLLTLLSASGLWYEQQDATRHSFEVEAVEHAEVIQRAFERRLFVADAVAGLFDVSPEVSADQFRHFVQPLLGRFPLLEAVVWVSSTPGTGSAGSGAGVRHHFPVLFIEPETYAPLVGTDLGESPLLTKDLNQAARERTTVASPELRLPEFGRGTVFFTFRPVFTGPDSRELLGYAATIFRIRPIIEFALTQIAPGGTDIFVYDWSPAGKRLLYVHPSRIRNPSSPPPSEATAVSSRLRHTSVFEIAGRRWAIVQIPAPGQYLLRPAAVVWAVFLGGIAFTLVLSSYVFVVRREGRALSVANSSLNREIDERRVLEEALFEEKERAEVTLASIADAVITVDSRGLIVFVNPVAEALIGWTVAEAAGRPLGEVFQVVDERSGKAIADPVSACLRDPRPHELTQQAVLVNRTGQRYGIRALAAPIYGREEQVLGVVLTFRDVTRERRTVREIAHRAAHDSLTGLVNRREFEQRLVMAISSSRRYQRIHVLCYLDLDHFKTVNDTVGHLAGDELLKRVASQLEEGVRERDTLARMGGDEFALLLDNCPIGKALEIAEGLVARLRDLHFVWDGHAFDIGISIGISTIDGSRDDPKELLRQADAACYTAKAMGRNRVWLYQQESENPATAPRVGAATIHRALAENRFELYCQPMVPLAAIEAPPRWELLLRLPDAGEVLLPAVFLPVADRYGLMRAVDRWVIDAASRLCARLPAERELEIAINLSSEALGDESLTDFIVSQLSGNPQARRLCFEIPESAAIHNLMQTERFVQEIKGLGARVALDRVGGSPASLNYLRHLPVDYVKFDDRYVRDLVEDRVGRAMLAAVNQMGHVLNIQTVAGFAETPEIVGALRELGIDFVQGNAVAPPRPLGEVCHP